MMTIPAARGIGVCAVVFSLLMVGISSAEGQRGRGGGGGNGRGGGGGGGGVAASVRGPTTALPGPTPLGLNASARIPADNPLTPEKIALGKKLFFDPMLSRDRTVACSTCHKPEAAFADDVALSPGILGRKGARNSPTLFNRVYGQSFFLDGRAATLEQAVLMPVQDTLEMAMTLPDVIQRISADATYRTLFRTAFNDQAVNELRVSQALASYVRSLRSGNSPADRYERGDLSALSASAIRGRELFFGRANCEECHDGSNFTNEDFERDGVPSADPGRSAVSGNGRTGEFKVPSLRNIALTAPYMHDGSLKTLEAVVDFYNLGGGRAFGRPVSNDVRRLNLSQSEKADLVAFLRALTSDTNVF